MARSILFVHAHPDDESIGTGATMAHYAAQGAHVTLVTCTLGEEGEIHVPELAQLEAAQADQLGGYRLTELRTALAALGDIDHRMLGGAGRYRDSGMMGTPANEHPRSFWGADLEEASAHLVEIMDEVRPQVVVTYDANGFYGHPDHIQAHRVAMRASEIAAERGFGPSKIYWTAMPLSVLKAGVEALADSTDNPFAAVTDVADFPFGTPDEEVAACIDGSDHHDAKVAALKAHATQIPETSWLYSIAGNFGQEFMGVEHYTLAHGVRGRGDGPYGWETDLFSGLSDGSPAAR
ncbi:N-acetyl-1-D-myo-inositol-2-amino-2-deoxy-alpha-D-glucopyranoside deacetylase [Catellatospora citrea]|uniref:N-acetyl-1-D-myo-inositol-2-amino-2-deoxy-alpha- D-glucopyranoside deacetylase n=1 Tax=Catellatospora citrea TaxID=53366 RepID=UPI0033EE4C3D